LITRFCLKNHSIQLNNAYNLFIINTFLHFTLVNFCANFFTQHYRGNATTTAVARFVFVMPQRSAGICITGTNRNNSSSAPIRGSALRDGRTLLVHSFTLLFPSGYYAFQAIGYLLPSVFHFSIIVHRYSFGRQRI
jgi:hypothetical protein